MYTLIAATIFLFITLLIIFVVLGRLNIMDGMLEKEILTVNERVTSLAFRVSDIEQKKETK